MSALDSLDAPRWSAVGFRHGVRLGLPVTPGVIAFGLIVGAVAERQGFSFIEHIALTVLVYSGIAQLVALEIWPKVIDIGTIATLSALTAVIGSRLFLMSVSMRPWFGKLPWWQSYSGLFLLTDASWLIAMRYRGEGGRDPAVYFGAAIIITLGWIVGTVIGYFLGGFLVEPKKYGLDLVLPVFFAAMLVPLWAGPRRAIGWGVAGIVAVAAEQVLPGYWFIIVGAVCGALAGGFLDEAKDEVEIVTDLGTAGIWLAIGAMAVVNYAIRAGGFFLMGYVPLTPRVRAILNALPGAVVVAIVLPLVVRGGLPAAAAVLIAIAMMAWRRNDLLAVVCGMGTGRVD